MGCQAVLTAADSHHEHQLDFPLEDVGFPAVLTPAALLHEYQPEFPPEDVGCPAVLIAAGLHQPPQVEATFMRLWTEEFVGC